MKFTAAMRLAVHLALGLGLGSEVGSTAALDRKPHVDTLAHAVGGV